MSDQTKSPGRAVEGKRGSRRWWLWLRDIVLLLLLFGALQWWQGRNLSTGRAPVLVGHLSDGTPYQLDPAKGPTLVHFWASWCPICRLEQDSIESIAGDSPVITVATTSGSPQEVEQYLAEQDLQMPVLMDEDGEIARRWGVGGVPATFVVDAAGDIRHAGMGYSSELGLRLRLWLAE